MPKTQTPLLIELMSHLGKTAIIEEYILKEGKNDIYGYLNSAGAIVINPVPHIVDTLLHELLHKTHPEYSEHAVRSLVGKLMKHASDADLQAIYAAYQERINHN